jgi:transposase InsO family protein
MTAAVMTCSPEREASVLRTLQRIRATHGYVSNRDVQRAADALGCSTRRVRRMLERGYVHKPRSRWKPKTDLTVSLVRWEGSVAQLHQDLCNKGKDPGVSKRTMQRYFATDFDQRVRAAAKDGYSGLKAAWPVFDREVAHRNDEWAVDHTQLPNWVRLPDGTCVKPWLTTVLDAATRMVLAFTLSPYSPNTEVSVETVALAAEGFTTEDGVFVGGQPLSLHSDRGSDLATHAMTIGLIEHGTSRSFTEAYTPEQNGRIERWHGVIKREVCPGLPGFDRTAWEPSDPRRDPTPRDPAALLDFAGMVLEILRAFRSYNFTRQHGALGCSPYEAWCADEAEVRRVDAQALRASMTQEMTRTVRRSRVQWDRRFYMLASDCVPEDGSQPAARAGLPWRSLVEGKQVRLRFFPSRFEFVEVYTLDGDYVGRAHWTKYLDTSEAAKAAADRRSLVRTLRTSLEEIAAADAEGTQTRRAQTATDEDSNDPVWGSRGPKTSRSNKKSATTDQRRAAQRERAQHDLHAMEAVVLARTGTADDDF